MQRRRQHFECESRPGIGCLIYGTSRCSHRPRLVNSWRRCFSLRLTIELWWLLLCLLPILFSWVWALEVLWNR